MVKEFLSKNKKIIIMIGFIIGLAGVLGILPLQLLGDLTKYGFGIIIVIAGYCFYEFYWDEDTNPKQPLRREQRPQQPPQTPRQGY